MPLFERIFQKEGRRHEKDLIWEVNTLQGVLISLCLFSFLRTKKQYETQTDLK